MKRAVTVFVIFAILLAFVKPNVSLAAINETELEVFGKAEGFKDIEEFKDYFSIYFYDHDLESVSSVNELKSILGERLNEENVGNLILEYGFTDREELTEVLIEFDELAEGDTIEETFIYVNALKSVLVYFEDTLTPITDENLNELLQEYDMTLDELKTLLANNGDSVDNYEYIEDLDAAVYEYLSYTDVPAEGIAEIGLTEEEIERLLKHILSIDLEDPALEERMLALEERVEALPEFDSASELTQAQLEEMASIFTEIMDIYQLKAAYSLVKDGSKTALSLNELLVLKTTNGADLLIELYSTNGEFLADIIITADMFGSELIDEVEEIAKPITQPVQNPPKKVDRTIKKVDRTIKGGKMPNTAGNYTEGLLAGLLLIGAGSSLLIRRKRNAA